MHDKLARPPTVLTTIRVLDGKVFDDLGPRLSFSELRVRLIAIPVVEVNGCASRNQVPRKAMVQDIDGGLIQVRIDVKQRKPCVGSERRERVREPSFIDADLMIR